MNERVNELLVEAEQVAVQANFVSISLLQRKMRIGFVDASRLIDELVGIGFCDKENDIFGKRRLRSATDWQRDDIVPADRTGANVGE